MKVTIIFTLMMFSIVGYCQSSTWQYLIDTDNDMVINDLLEMDNESIFFVGKTGNFENNIFNGLLFKLSKNGQFTDSLSLKLQDTTTSIANILLNNNIDTLYNLNVIYKNISNQNSGFKLLNIDTCFNIITNKKYDFPAQYKIITSTFRKGLNNKLIIGGTVTINQFYKLFLYTFTSTFDSINAKFFLNDPSIILGGINELNDNSFWLVEGTIPYYWHVDSNLNLISAKAGYIPHYIVGNYGIKWDSDTSFFMAGNYSFDINRTTDLNIGFFHQYDSFDSTGNIFNWWGASDTLDSPAYFGALDYQNKDSIFIGGSKNLQYGNIFFGTIPSWYVLLQTDSMLNIRWERFYGGDACYNMTKLIATNDGGCIMAGTRFDFKAHPWVHERDIYILKVNAEGLITSANGQIAPTVHDAIVYPNPGSNHLKIRVGVQHKQSTFKLFDMTGRQVLEKHIEERKAEINTQFLKPGTYVYTITNNNGLNENGKWVKE